MAAEAPVPVASDVAAGGACRLVGACLSCAAPRDTVSHSSHYLRTGQVRDHRPISVSAAIDALGITALKIDYAWGRETSAVGDEFASLSPPARRGL